MSRKPLLNEQDEKTVAQMYKSGEYTQDELALHYCVSRGTIQRILERQGVVKYNFQAPQRLSQSDKDLLAMARQYGLTATELKQSMDALHKLQKAPRLTQGNVLLHLTQISPQEFASMLYAVGSHKVADMRQKRETGIDTGKAAANG